MNTLLASIRWEPMKKQVLAELIRGDITEEQYLKFIDMYNAVKRLMLRGE